MATDNVVKRTNMRTDNAVVQLPVIPPGGWWGGLDGAGNIFTDPNFGTEILRLSDGSQWKFNSIQTADANQAIWSLDDTMIACSAVGGHNLIYDFDPVNFKGTPTTLKVEGDCHFSRVTPLVMYTHSKGVIQKLTFSRSPSLHIAKTEPVADFTTKLPVGFKIKWSGTFFGSADDSTFCIGYSQGAQNTGFYVCVWRAGSGYRILNTQTGEVTGDWGPIGKAISPIPFPYTIHECSPCLNRDYVTVQSMVKGERMCVWPLDGLTLIEMSSSGHNTKGMKHIYNGSAGGGQLQEHPYTDLAAKRNVVAKEYLPANQKPPQHYQFDTHFAMGKVDPNDASIVFATNHNPLTPYVSEWESELIGYDIVKGVVYRVCHTFNSAKSKEFVVQTAMANPSQTNKFVAFTSDAMGTLGSTSGGAIGKLGVDARGDVFIARVIF